VLDALALPPGTRVNPSGGALAAHPIMSAGLIRMGEVARRISSGDANRGVAHATSGPCLQQNLVCVLEGA
jgi:acetyl-CoA acetyltransferase